MTGERLLELINAGIDGELNESGQSELQEILDNSEEARSLHAAWQSFAATMAAVPQRDPPADLRQKILEQVQQPGKRRKSFRGSFRGFQLSPFTGYGIALAAGLVMIVGIYRLGPWEPTGADISNMTGTIVEQPAPAQAVVLDSQPFELEQIRGTVSLLGGGDTYVLEFAAQSADAMDVVIDLTASGLQFAGFQQPDISAGDVSVTGESIRVRLAGDKRFAMNLERSGDKPIHITTEIFSAGGRVHQGTLKTQ